MILEWYSLRVVLSLFLYCLWSSLQTLFWILNSVYLTHAFFHSRFLRFLSYYLRLSFSFRSDFVRYPLALWRYGCSAAFLKSPLVFSHHKWHGLTFDTSYYKVLHFAYTLSITYTEFLRFGFSSKFHFFLSILWVSIMATLWYDVISSSAFCCILLFIGLFTFYAGSSSVYCRELISASAMIDNNLIYLNIFFI